MKNTLAGSLTGFNGIGFDELTHRISAITAPDTMKPEHPNGHCVEDG
jgi:hypothetical protein